MTPGGTKSEKIERQGEQKWPQGHQKWAQGHQKWAKGHQKLYKSEPKSAKREPKVDQNPSKDRCWEDIAKSMQTEGTQQRFLGGIWDQISIKNVLKKWC